MVNKVRPVTLPMNNIHAILDNVAVNISAFALGKHKFFSESIESSPLAEHLKSITVQMPTIKGPGRYSIVADTLVGKLEPAFMITQWKGENYPTVLYHHGNTERPFDFRCCSPNTFKNIFLTAKQPIQANLIALSAPFHRSTIMDYLRKLSELANVVALLSVSVKLIEELVAYLKEHGSHSVMVAGISLGGWITNIHRAYFNTAHVYVPLLAGAKLGDIFSTSIYHKMTGRLAQEHPEVLKKALNFEDRYKRIRDDNVFPVLARYDQIIQYDRQRVCYDERAIKTLEKGHITGSFAHHNLRAHILKHLKGTEQ
jgi:predicted esterase YcpF (UPF0227 family)